MVREITAEGVLGFFTVANALEKFTTGFALCTQMYKDFNPTVNFVSHYGYFPIIAIGILVFCILQVIGMVLYWRGWIGTLFCCGLLYWGVGVYNFILLLHFA